MGLIHRLRTALFTDDPPRPKARDEEIASTADGRDITRGYVDALDLLPVQDELLQAKGGNYDLYRAVLSEGDVQAKLQSRRLAVTAAEWEVQAGGERRQDKRAADWLREQLHSLQWDKITTGMHYGVYYGFAIAECLYGREAGLVTLESIKVRDRRRFGFGPDFQPRLLTSEKPMGEDLPPGKFWLYSTGADHDDEPYGLGLAHWLYWPVLFKRNGIKLWLIHSEKYGSPTSWGKFPPNATEGEKQRLLYTLQAIQQDSAVITPEGMTIELVEAKRGGSLDYSVLCRYMDGLIAKIILGQTLTSESEGGQYKAEVQNEVRRELVKADADLICSSFNDSVVEWLTAWNFPGAEPPRVWRLTEDPEDLNQRAERDKLIFDMGFKPSEQYIQDTYGGEWTVSAPPPPSPPAGNGVGAKNLSPVQGEAFADPAFAEPTDDPAALIAERLAAAGDPLIAAWVERLTTLVEQAGSLDELRGLLLSAYGDLPDDELGRVLTAGLLAAEAAGRFDLDEESG